VLLSDHCPNVPATSFEAEATIVLQALFYILRIIYKNNLPYYAVSNHLCFSWCVIMYLNPRDFKYYFWLI